MDRDEERAIEWDCAKVLNEFYVFTDAGDYEGAANLFTEDGIWTLWDIKLDSRQAICDSLRDGFTPVFIKHFLTNIIVTVIDKDHANAVAYSAVYRQEKDEMEGGVMPLVAPWALGRMDNKMVRTKDGWRIARRDVDGWLRRETAAHPSFESHKS